MPNDFAWAALLPTSAGPLHIWPYFQHQEKLAGLTILWPVNEALLP